MYVTSAGHFLTVQMVTVSWLVMWLSVYAQIVNFAVEGDQLLRPNVLQ